MNIKYLLPIIIMLLILGCSSKEVINETNEVTDEPPIPTIPETTQTDEPIPQDIPQDIPNNIVVEIPEEKPIETIVFIKDREFYPQNITIYKGETITWVVDLEAISNNQPRMVACYSGSKRIFLGTRMTEKGQRIEYTFTEPGDYLCQEAIYGLRGDIHVKKQSRNAITGAFIGAAGDVGIAPAIIILSLIALAILYTQTANKHISRKTKKSSVKK